MNNLVYLNNDPILVELDSSVDRESTMKMIAFKYYGDVRYWWVIAWYNGVALEGDLINGDLMEIPINLRETLAILGV